MGISKQATSHTRQRTPEKVIICHVIFIVSMTASVAFYIHNFIHFYHIFDRYNYDFFSFLMYAPFEGI